MCPAIVYLCANRRKPIHLSIRLSLSDRQGEIPHNWCEHCGKEIFAVHGCLCRRCAAERSLKT